MNTLKRKVSNCILGKKELMNLSIEANHPFVMPSVLSINITPKCNSKCIYCDEWVDNGKKSNGPTLDDIMKLSISAKKLGVKKIQISGGEPLLRKDLDQIISIFNENFKVKLITNGILLTKERLESMVKAGLKGLAISLDSFEPSLYASLRGVSFSYVENALRVVKQYKTRNPLFVFGISCVVSEYNARHLVSLVKEFDKRFPRIAFITFQAYDVGWGKKKELIPHGDTCAILRTELERVIELKRKGYLIPNSEEYLRGIADYLCNRKVNKRFECTSGFTAVSVDANMNLHPCYPLPEIADLRQEKLEEVWFSEKMKQQRSMMMNGKCPGCTCILNKNGHTNLRFSEKVKNVLNIKI